MRPNQDWIQLRKNQIIMDHHLLHRGYSILKAGDEFGNWTLEQIITEHSECIKEMKRRDLKHEIKDDLDKE